MLSEDVLEINGAIYHGPKRTAGHQLITSTLQSHDKPSYNVNLLDE